MAARDPPALLLLGSSPGVWGNASPPTGTYEIVSRIFDLASVPAVPLQGLYELPLQHEGLFHFAPDPWAENEVATWLCSAVVALCIIDGLSQEAGPPGTSFEPSSAVMRQVLDTWVDA